MKPTQICLVALLASGCIARSHGIGEGGAGTGAATGGGGLGGFGPTGGNGNGPSAGGTPGVGGSAAAAGVGGEGGSGAGAGGGSLPAGCFHGASAACNPLTNAGCSSGEACDVGIDSNQASHLVCYPPPNTQAVGATCNAQQGPFCAPGSLCTGSPGVCVPFCCSNAECAAGTSCAAIDSNIGTLGGCLPTGAGGSGGSSGSGGTSGASGHDLVACTGSAYSTGSVAGVTPQAKVSLVQTDPSGSVKVILLPKAVVSDGDVVIGVYFFAKKGQLNYPANGGGGCAVMRYQNGWQVLETTQMCDVQLSALTFASQPGTCDGVMVGSFTGLFSGNAPLGGTFSVPLEIAESQVKPPSCQGYNGPCSQHSDCCSKSCSVYIGVCN